MRPRGQVDYTVGNLRQCGCEVCDHVRFMASLEPDTEADVLKWAIDAWCGDHDELLKCRKKLREAREKLKEAQAHRSQHDNLTQAFEQEAEEPVIEANQLEAENEMNAQVARGANGQARSESSITRPGTDSDDDDDEMDELLENLKRKIKEKSKGQMEEFKRMSLLSRGKDEEMARQRKAIKEIEEALYAKQELINQHQTTITTMQAAITTKGEEIRVLMQRNQELEYDMAGVRNIIRRDKERKRPRTGSLDTTIADRTMSGTT
jgi:hypothetical protein